MAEIREPDLPRDLDAVGRLWLDYLLGVTTAWSRRTASDSRSGSRWSKISQPSPCSQPTDVASFWLSRTT
jgi:hypothetical protein